MNSAFENVTAAAIERVVACAQRYWLATIFVSLSAAVAGGWYTATHVAISTSTEEMLSAELPWRVAYSDYKNAFPYFTDSIVVVADGATPDRALEASDALARALRERTDLFTDVFHPADDPFFRRHQFLYQDLDDLATLSDDISAAQPFLARLAAEPGLLGFLGLLRETSEHADTVDGLAIEPIYDTVSSALEAFVEGDASPMSWQRLMLGDAVGSTRSVFTAQPRLDFSNILPGKPAIEMIREVTAQFGLTAANGVTVRLTGAAALSYDELRSVVRGAEQAGLLAFVMVTACLVIGLRSLSLVIATLITLVVGLVGTATFAVFAVGTLNMISVAFAVLYVGLGVDFAIHVCLRYRELAYAGNKHDAIAGAARHIGGSIVLCAITTSIGFFAFIPTAYRGVAELGLISGVGMFIGLLCSFTVLPAVLQALPPPRPPRPGSDRGHAAARLPQRRSAAVLVLACLLAAAAGLVLPAAKFDHNPLHLNDRDAESVVTINDLLDDADSTPYSISLIADSREEAIEMARALEGSDEVSRVTTVLDLVPEDQGAKLALIGDLALLLGDALERGEPVPADAASVIEAARKLEASARRVAADAPEGLAHSATRLGDAAGRLSAFLAGRDAGAAAKSVAEVEHKLMHHFEPQLARLQDGLEADEVTIEKLPADLRRRWIASDGRFRLEVQPAHNLEDNHHLERFVNEVRRIGGPTATDVPVINIEASRAVISAFYQAFVSALFVIAVLLYIILRRAAEVLTVLAPLLLAGLLTTAITVLANIPFNFANVIALPLLMGIGVDSALHILHRHKTHDQEDIPLLKTSTARAVLFSALTTTASFGNLALSPHSGTASMGVMLTIGLTMTIVCTLVVLPALLERYVQPAHRIT